MRVGVGYLSSLAKRQAIEFLGRCGGFSLVALWDVKKSGSMSGSEAVSLDRNTDAERV